MEDVEERSRRHERLPIKPQKKDRRIGGKIENKEKLYHFEFRIRFCKKPLENLSFTKQSLSCIDLRSNVFPETPYTDLSIGRFSPEKPPAPLICLCECKLRGKSKVG